MERVRGPPAYPPRYHPLTGQFDQYSYIQPARRRPEGGQVVGSMEGHEEVTIGNRENENSPQLLETGGGAVHPIDGG